MKDKLLNVISEFGDLFSIQDISILVHMALIKFITYKLNFISARKFI